MMESRRHRCGLADQRAGHVADLETSRSSTTKAKQAERDYPGRFIGAAHAIRSADPSH